MNISHDNPDCIWINPDVFDDGNGSFERPYSSIEPALSVVKPGQAIVFQAGEYVTDCNIQVSGTASNPIRIVGQPGAQVVVKAACWFFYDTSDLIVEGMSFVDAPNGAISVIGACSRNRFSNISFVNCGERRATACTLYIGGAGGGCNVVEDCSFVRPAGDAGALSGPDVSVGLMISQGDTVHGNPIVNCLVRHNRFENYGYGIIVGGDEARSVRCGHMVEFNTVLDCSGEGILIKSGDTRVRANVIERSRGTALLLRSELDGSIEDNRVVDCRRGICVHGAGHTVAGNCLVRCTEGAIRVEGVLDPYAGTTTNCFIENNTCIDCGAPDREGADRVAGILIDKGTTGILQNNFIAGRGKPYAVVDRIAVSGDDIPPGADETQFVIKDNFASAGCLLLDGVRKVAVRFSDEAADDYSNECGYGAAGWVLKPQGFDPVLDLCEEDGEYRMASIVEDDDGNPIIPGSDDDSPERLFGTYFHNEDGASAGDDDGELAALLHDEGDVEDSVLFADDEEDKGPASFRNPDSGDADGVW